MYKTIFYNITAENYLSKALSSFMYTHMLMVDSHKSGHT